MSDKKNLIRVDYWYNRAKDKDLAVHDRVEAMEHCYLQAENYLQYLIDNVPEARKAFIQIQGQGGLTL